MRPFHRALVAGTVAALGLVPACGAEEESMSQDPMGDAPSFDSGPGVESVWASDIPVATTPPGGWTTWPEPVLAACTEPLVEGAPDLRGLWQVVGVEADGVAQPDHRAMGGVQRIEQCGDRLVVTAAGIVHDMRVDGTEANGVHDVAEMDKTTPITVVATYEDGVHVLRPVGLPVEVRRWRDGGQLVWEYLGFTARLDRIGPPDETPTT
ncbi:MAG: hypothetical protein MUF83_21430 [Acidimicrobiales bacterium]|jgi:hypothetical protein|nr:hypothetical protein [Acidimicrobiales bacterium]